MNTTQSYSSDFTDRVNDQLAAFRARNNLRNDPNYVLEVDERIAARRAGLRTPGPAIETEQGPALQNADTESALSYVTTSLTERTPKRNWFGFKQR